MNRMKRKLTKLQMRASRKRTFTESVKCCGSCKYYMESISSAFDHCDHPCGNKKGTMFFISPGGLCDLYEFFEGSQSMHPGECPV